MQAKIFNQNILQQISECAKSKSDQEICGIVTTLNNNQEFIELKNLAEDKKNFFYIDPFVFLSHDVDFIVHSHCLGTAQPSSCDMRSSDCIDVPYLIYSTVYDNFCLYQNNSVITFKV